MASVLLPTTKPSTWPTWRETATHSHSAGVTRIHTASIPAHLRWLTRCHRSGERARARSGRQQCVPLPERRFFSDVTDRQARHFEGARDPSLADSLLERRHDLGFFVLGHGAAVGLEGEGLAALVAAASCRPAAVGAEAFATRAAAAGAAAVGTVWAGLSNHDHSLQQHCAKIQCHNLMPRPPRVNSVLRLKNHWCYFRGVPRPC